MNDSGQPSADDDQIQSLPVRGANGESDPMTRIKVMYEDNHLIAAIKPAGILSQADGSGKPDMLTLLKQDIKIRYGKPGQVFLGLVHRLDQPVSGVMVFARTSKAAARLSAQIREHRVDKYYLAVVHGCPTPAAGSLLDRLSKNPSTGQVRIVGGDQGQVAWLDYCVIETLADPGGTRSLDRRRNRGDERREDQNEDRRLTLVAIRLGSGRGHQIRIQLASRGWPIVGDHRYGRLADQSEPVDPALFACRFSLDHPVSAQRLHLDADPPDVLPWSLFKHFPPESIDTFFSENRSAGKGI